MLDSIIPTAYPIVLFIIGTWTPPVGRTNVDVVDPASNELFAAVSQAQGAPGSSPRRHADAAGVGPIDAAAAELADCFPFSMPSLRISDCRGHQPNPGGLLGRGVNRQAGCGSSRRARTASMLHGPGPAAAM